MPIQLALDEELEELGELEELEPFDELDELEPLDELEELEPLDELEEELLMVRPQRCENIEENRVIRLLYVGRWYLLRIQVAIFFECLLL